MSQELHYTSVARGLKPGARGFCTVASTVGLSPTLAERLEGLSGYRANFPPDHPQSAQNPVAWSHLRISSVGQTVSVISRIGPAGLDYTDRPNKYAHHVVLEATERPVGGPAWLLEQPGFMVSEWQGPPQQITTGRRPVAGDRLGGVCRAWAKATGDAGWGGVVAEAFMADSRRQVVVVFDPGVDVLSLFAEAIALLPSDRRWEVTFQTYFTGLPPGVSCLWRGVLRDSAEARQARGNPDALLIDLAEAGHAVGGSFVHWAKTGEATVAPTSSIPQSPDRSSPHVTPPSPVAAQSSRRVARPGPTSPVEPPLHDPYSLGPPPVPQTDGRLRESRKRKPRPVGSPSPWPIVLVGAIAFILGTSFGGAAVYLLLQSRGPESLARIVDVAEKKSSATVAVEDPIPNKKGIQTSIVDVEKGKASKNVVSADQKAEPKLDAPNLSSTKPPVAHAQKPENPFPPSGKQEYITTQNENSRIREPEEKEPIPIKFFALANANGNQVSPFVASKKVQSVSLIGGDDSRLVKYRFKPSPNAEKNKLKVDCFSNDGQILEGEMGTFHWLEHDNKVSFKWTEQPQEQAAKQAFQNCIIDVRFEDGTGEYAILRGSHLLIKPVQKPLSMTTKSIEWASNQDSTVVDFATNRFPSLYEIKLVWPDKQSSMVSIESPPKRSKPQLPPRDSQDLPTYVSEDKEIEAKLAFKSPYQIRFDIKTDVISPTDKELNSLKETYNQLQLQLQNLRQNSQNASFQAHPPLQLQITKAESDSRHAETKFNNALLAKKKRLQDFANSTIEFKIVIEVGGKKFLLSDVNAGPK